MSSRNQHGVCELRDRRTFCVGGSTSTDGRRSSRRLVAAAVCGAIVTALRAARLAALKPKIVMPFAVSAGPRYFPGSDPVVGEVTAPILPSAALVAAPPPASPPPPLNSPPQTCSAEEAERRLGRAGQGVFP